MITYYCSLSEDQSAVDSVATVQLDSAQLGFGGFGWHALSESSQAINSPAGLCRLRLTCNLVMLVVHI